ALRQHEVEEREHRFLHLARIRGATDQHQTPGEIACDHRLRAAAVALRIGAEAWQAYHRQPLLEPCELARNGPPQQVVDEQRVPSVLADNANVETARRLRPREQVLHEELAPLGMLQEVPVEHVELFARHRLVRIPPDRFFGALIAYLELVLGSAARM